LRPLSSIPTLLLLFHMALPAQTVHDAAAFGNLTQLDSLYQIDKECIHAVHTQNGGQPLHMAAWAGQVDAISWLVENGANINAMDRRNAPVIVWAIANGQVAALERLTALGADIKATHPRMGSLLHIAAGSGTAAVIDFLVAQGLDVNLPGRFGFTPLHYAVFRKNASNVAALLRCGAAASTPNHDGSTPLFMAVDAGDTTVVAPFFQSGLSVNTVNEFGDTPLHAAVYGGHEILSQYLIDQGADVNLKDDAGRSAIEIARQRGLTSLVELLQLADAKESASLTASVSAFKAVTPLDTGLMQPVKVTVIYDNFVHRQGMEADWGFSLLIEAIDKTILFDTGTKPELMMKNFDALGLDAASVDLVFLSHEHGDHTGGLFRFLKRRSGIPVVMPYSFSYSFVRRVSAAGAKPVALKSPKALCDHVYSSGELGTAIKEHCVILNTKKGLVVITGCSHPGIVEMLESVQSTFKKKIHMVFGGFHLMNHSDEAIAKIIEKMKALGVEKCGATHCTGAHQIELFKRGFGKNYVPLGVGNVLTF